MTNGYSAVIGTRGQVANAALNALYFPRRLLVSDNSFLGDQANEAGVLALSGNKIILGEPGMGKSELMRELGRQLDVQPVTAIRFINAKNPAKLVSAGKPVLIDGLDEAISRREGDAVDAILAQLEEADSPPFILSCRSREWQERSVTNLRQLYGAEPRILTLQPFDRSEARAFLVAQHPSVDAQHVLAHLASYSLEELYRNPLTLGLMGRVAASDAKLPATRAGLFERVCTLIWPEHDPDRQDQGLAQLTEDEAFDAAGAIAAALLFAGAEAASAAGAAQILQSDLRLADLEILPKAKVVRAIFSSKLFHSVGQWRAKPIHRVIAEFLGARWLARQTTTPRAQRRVLAQLHGNGGVPASLRGLHAWLAYHSAAMAERVIAEDPYGVLRYGETATLTPHLADCLFDALCRLAKDDPFFRAADWDSKTAAGLMIPALGPKIEAIIVSTASGAHLRSLLIEGLEATPLAAEFADTLEAIMLAPEPERSYSERSDAANALLPHRDRAWWRATIAALTNQGGRDAPRLAHRLIQHFDADVSDELLVATLFAEIGAISCPLRRHQERRVYTDRSYDALLDVIPAERLVGILDLIANYVDLLRDGDWGDGSGWGDASAVADIMAYVMVRAIDENLVGPGQAPALWRWLGTYEPAHCSNRHVQQTLARRLAEHDDLRRAIQAYVLAHDRRKGSLWVTEGILRRRRVELRKRPGDIACALDRLLTQGDNNDRALRQDWKDLVRIGWGPAGLNPEVQTAAESFRRGDKPLAAFLLKLANPKKPPWKIRQEKRARKRDRKRKVAFETARREYQRERYDLRVGNLKAILYPAKAYLNLSRALPSELPPYERLATWIGSSLRDDALTGFEAVLHRTDLPTPAETANGFAHGMIYNYGFPIMAGLYERLRSGRGIADLPQALKQTALLLSHNDRGWNLDEEKKVLRAALEADVIPTPQARQDFARLWFEPALAAANEPVVGLYKLAHDPKWQATGAALAARWLAAFPHVPGSVEAELVDCLAYGGALDALRGVAEARAATVFRNLDHLLFWLAIDVLVRFDQVRPYLAGIGANCPDFIWFLRDQLRFDGVHERLPLSIAQAEWIVAEFREQWPGAHQQSFASGDTNDADAHSFLYTLINRIAGLTDLGAAEAMARLVAGPEDSYGALIRHMAAEQRQKRAEEDFCALSPGDLVALLDDGPPGNIEDLKALVLEELAVAQRKLLGEDLDSVVEFWTDAGIPRDENRCRDRLAAMLGPELARYNIQRITEADMPWTNRADLAFARGTMQLPLEVKGQWHSKVWDAATGQLDMQYLIDWRSEQRGIYCVLWFGDLMSSTNRRLKAHPDGLAAPSSAEEMRMMLIDRLDSRCALIDVVVLDLTAGAVLG